MERLATERLATERLVYAMVLTLFTFFSYEQIGVNSNRTQPSRVPAVEAVHLEQRIQSSEI